MQAAEEAAEYKKLLAQRHKEARESRHKQHAKRRHSASVSSDA